MAYWGNFNYLTKNQDKLQFQYRNMENALFTGIAIDLMLSHGQNENNMKEITGVINE